MKEIKFTVPDISDLEIENVVEVLRSGWITTGPKTKLLEKKLAGFVGDYNENPTGEPSVLNPQPSTLNPQPSIFNLQSSTFNLPGACAWVQLQQQWRLH